MWNMFLCAYASGALGASGGIYTSKSQLCGACSYNFTFVVLCHELSMQPHNIEVDLDLVALNPLDYSYPQPCTP